MPDPNVRIVGLAESNIGRDLCDCEVRIVDDELLARAHTRFEESALAIAGFYNIKTDPNMRMEESLAKSRFT